MQRPSFARTQSALIEFDGKASATPMRDTLIAANAAVRQARETGATALAPGLAFHRALPRLARNPQSRG